MAVDDPPDPDPNDPDVPAIPVWAGASVVVSTLANDTDVEIDAGSSTQSLTVTGASQGMKGKVIFTAESVIYVPNPNESGTDSFTYTVADGAGRTAVGAVQIEIYRLDLDIYNGQGAASPVPEEKEECVGAFTVANLNDTDGDGADDNIDMNGVVATPNGRDEVDLMKLVLRKPVPFEGGMVTLSVSGSVALWEESTKQTSIALTNGEVQFDLSGGDKTIWVELTAASQSVRDVTLSLSYDWQSIQVGGLVSVRATGVWATLTAVEHDTKSDEALLAEDEWKNMTDPPREIVELMGGTGFLPGATGVFNGILMQYTVAPEGIDDEPDVKFDITRRVQSKSIPYLTNGDPPAESLCRHFPDKIEKPNDDAFGQAAETGSSEAPNAENHMFDYDSPGISDYIQPNQQVGWIRMYMNFESFVRVRVDGIDPAGLEVSGSAASTVYKWHARHYLQLMNGTTWVRVGGNQQETTKQVRKSSVT